MPSELPFCYNHNQSTTYHVFLESLNEVSISNQKFRVGAPHQTKAYVIRNSASKTPQGFVQQGFNSIKGWMGNFVSSKGITAEGVVGSLKNYIDIADDKLDYVAGFLDATTNYFDYTGVQTVGRRLIERAVAEI